jgi:type 1 glutamine amidotransferase
MKKFIIISLFLLIGQSVFAQNKPIKLVFIAGPNDHCGNNPCHKYIEDLTLLKNCLESSKAKQKYEVKLYIGERPPVGSLDDVAAVVIHSSGDRVLKEWHALFPQNQNPDGYNVEYRKFLNDFDAQIMRGMGLMVMHYATWVNHPEAQKYMMNWVGGHYLAGKSKVDGNKKKDGTTAIETVTIASPKHPILKGVKPWTADSEFYYNIHFKENDKRFTPLLTSDLPIDEPKNHVVSWAIERPDGGRGVGFTEGHFPTNMLIEDFRKFVLNAIVWTAKGKIPKKGFESIIEKE